MDKLKKSVHHESILPWFLTKLFFCVNFFFRKFWFNILLNQNSLLSVIFCYQFEGSENNLL